MKLVLSQGDGRAVYALPEKRSGRYWIGVASPRREDEGLLYVEGVNGAWVLVSNKRAQIISDQGQKVAEQTLSEREIYQIALIGSQETATLYVEPETLDRKTFAKYRFPQDGRFTIGSDPNATVSFDNSHVAATQLTLRYKDGMLTALASSEGTSVYLGSKRLDHDQGLAPGEHISILDLDLVIGAGFFAINNPDGRVRLAEGLSSFPAPEVAPSDPNAEIEESQPGRLFSRSPRFKRPVNIPKIKVDSPPAEEKQDETPLMLMIGPSVTMGLSSGIMALAALNGVLNGTSSLGSALPMLIMALVMMVGMIVWPTLSRRFEAKRKTKKEFERREKYGAYLDKLDVYIEHEKRKQSEILHENFVDIQECIERIRNRERTLWERSQAHDDFLQARLGLGDRPFMSDLQAPEQSFTVEDDIMQKRLFDLAEKPQILHEAPIILPLLEQFGAGVIGDRGQTVAFMKSLIFQLAALHSYDEVKFLFIYGEDENSEWDFTRWLPHVWTSDKSMRLVARTQEEVRQLSSFISQVALGRVEGDQEKPHYIVFALDRKLASKCDILTSIMKAKEYQNVSVVTVYDQLGYLPKDCSVVIEVDEERSRIYDRNSISEMYVGFTPDPDLALDADKLARELANTRLETAESAFALPQMLEFLEMYNAGKVEHLNARTRWKENNPVRSLQAPVGVGVTGELLMLDLHEKAHGPHGLIAGMTGSGKSEFIMTYILSLALNYHPDEVAFVLIDYKGGGMANAFAHLPHTVGVITNLDGASVNRSLASIQSELKRRQAIFNEAAKATHVSNIDIYKYQSLYREGQVTEPLPHLLIISDEFAELKTQQPEFMEQLISAARIGRSLGVHLILATQKPSGVVNDQIWANSKFKICLKVQDKADSQEMIKRSDAAELVETGRFYLQVGYNELFELGQSAWAGATYAPSDHVAKDYDASVTLIDVQGHPLVRVEPPRAGAALAGKTKQLDEVTGYLIEVANEDGIAVRQLWMPPLSERIYLDDLMKKYLATLPKVRPYQLDVVMGEYDDPSTQTQGLMELSLTDGGNLLLFGMTGGGKTHFINTMLFSLISDHSAKELNCYLLDFGSETLTSFAPAPQIGDVLISSDEEKVGNLFRMLEGELARRKKLFVEYGGDFQSYVQYAEEPVPNIVVVINNFAAFTEMFEEAEDWLARLTREGVKYGIYFVLTSASTNAVRYRVQQNFKQSICLQVADKDEYSTLFGRLENLMPTQTPGRGLYRTEEGVFEFQTALISEELADSPRDLRNHYAEETASYQGTIAPAVPCLPEAVTAEFLGLTEADLASGKIPVGVEKESMDLASFDFINAPATMVMAASDSWRDFMKAFARMLEACQTGCVGYLGEGGSAEADEAGVTSVDISALVKAGEKGKLPNLPSWLMVPSIAGVYDRLDLEAKASFIAAMRRLAEERKVRFLLGESADDFSSLTYESWVPEMLSLDSGIWIGNGFGDQYYLKPSGGTYYEEIGNKFGYVLTKGTAVLAKMLESEEASDE